MSTPTDVMIEIINNTKTRQEIIDFINQYGDEIAWEGWSDKQILEEVARSDEEAGETEDGILSAMYREL